MNYDDKKHIIEYIEGNKVKEFKVPEKDYNLKFNKMSYNDVIMYIRLTKEEDKKENQNNTLKYKPLKTVTAKTKDYFAQDIKLMSQAERLKKIAEFLVSGNIQELKEFISSDVFNDDPIIKSVMTLLNNKGYTYNEMKTLMKKRKEIDLYSSEIENCIVKYGETSYSFEDITFKNTLHDLLDLSKQINVLQEYTIFVPIDNPIIDKFNRVIDFDNKQKGFKKLYSIIFKDLKFSTLEGRKSSAFMSEDYVIPSDYTTNYKDYLLDSIKDFQLNNSKIPYYFYCTENQKIYINIKVLYYLLQFDPKFKNNNYKFVVEKLKNNVVENVILIAGSAFDLDNIINSLNEDDDKEKDYYNEYIKLMSETITKFFDKQFTPIIYKLEESKPKIKTMDLTFTDDKTDDKTDDETINDPDSKGIQAKDPDSKGIQDVMVEKPVEIVEPIKEGEGLFSFRRDTKETLQLLLNRIIQLENKVESQNEQIKELKLGIKSINQSLPDDKRKEVFGNYFSNSIRENGALNPDKVYPKITFSEFRKLYNKL